MAALTAKHDTLLRRAHQRLNAALLGSCGRHVPTVDHRRSAAEARAASCREPSYNAQDKLLDTARVVYAEHDWRRGVVVSGVRRINEVNARRARLVPG